MSGFEPRYARVVLVRFDRPAPHCFTPLAENEAEVELATSDPPYEYAYFVHVKRIDDLWEEGVSHN